MTFRGPILAGLLTTTALAGTGFAQSQPVAGLMPRASIIGQEQNGTGRITLDSSRPDSVPLVQARQSLTDALGEVYLTDPSLLAERAKLRATDESVPSALSGWRPQISYSLQPGFGYGTLTNRSTVAGNPLFNTPPTTTDQTFAESRWTFTQQVTATQPIWRGGRTTAATAQAEDNVRAERANLIAQENQSFSNAVTAFVGAVENQQIYDLNVDNVEITKKTLEATNLRFKVGEVTRTDVAQAEAAYAQAIAQRETAYGTLQTALASYRSAIGPVPRELVEPQPLALPAASESQAETVTLANNAAILNAEYADAAAKDAVNVAYANLMPQASFQVTAQYANQPNTRGLIDRGGSVGGVLSVPIYQGGSEYAAIRQAKQSEQQSRKLLDAARSNALQLVAQYWEGTLTAKTTVASTRDEIRADEIALDGVEREALSGTATTYDVLLAEQTLLSARLTLVQNLAALVTNSYQIAGAMGRLTARDLGLDLPRYNEKAYYNAVRLLPFGTGDHATHEPGR
jgi:outer membrane protein